MHVSTVRSGYTRLTTLPVAAVSVADGFWAERQQINRSVGLRHAYRQLEQAGNFHNLRLAAGLIAGQYRGPRYMDSDLYKWLEAVSYDLANRPDPQLEGWLDETAELLAAAQMPDGYLNAYFQAAAPEKRWKDLDHGHEMYCAGHLIQAAIACRRATGKSRLLEIARRLADHIDAVFGPGKRDGAPGHPEIEMALVELYRETGEARYLDLAGCLLSRRGRRRMRGLSGSDPEYQQDHLPLREAGEVAGHAVRQLYLTAGATDVYLETGEAALMEALQRLWLDMSARKMHLTGGYGARFEGESFGYAYELPNERCYCETCAAIAAMMWNWRMLLATGQARFADSLERSLYNNFLSGISLDGRSYFYVNPLSSPGGVGRSEWFGCACCPPNVMRQTAAVGQYIATRDAGGVQLHQYIAADLRVEGVAGGAARLSLETRYPWQGRVRITVQESPAAPWALSLRIPAWAGGAALALDGAPLDAALQPGSYARVERAWRPGETLELSLPLHPRLTRPNPRVDALRGSLAIERGPLVYCLEAVDQPQDAGLPDVRLDASAPLRASWQPDLLGGVVTVAAQGYAEDMSAWEGRLYRPAAEASPLPPVAARPLELLAVPYYAWANRGSGPMRVWIPV